MLRKLIVPTLAILAALPAVTVTVPANARNVPLRSFESALAAQPSASAALTGWCAAQAIANPPTITAERVGQPFPGSAAPIRQLLAVPAQEPVTHRTVQLKCGGTALSVAYNWYVPSRLTPEMNTALETGDTPFGTVVAPLQFTRQTLARVRGAMTGCPKDSVLSHLAVLKLPDGRAISVVIECYTRANLQPPG
jgi:hypothetical protein